MATAFFPLGQGLPSNAEGAYEWRSQGWRPLREADYRLFDRYRSARFFIRPWLEEDDPFGHDEANLLDMVGATIIFRSGHRLCEWDVPPRDKLRGLVDLALHHLERCSALGADAIEPVVSACCVTASCDKVSLDEAIQMSSDIVYIDAPGLFIISEGLHILRGFREINVAPIWRRFLIARRDAIENDFRLNDARRRWAAGLFARHFSFGLFPSEWRARR